MRQSRHRKQEDAILHDFDQRTNTLRILFVGPDGGMTPVTYKLCPVCGVTMDEEETDTGVSYSCTICGLAGSQAEESS